MHWYGFTPEMINKVSYEGYSQTSKQNILNFLVEICKIKIYLEKKNINIVSNGESMKQEINHIDIFELGKRLSIDMVYLYWASDRTYTVVSSGSGIYFNFLKEN